MLDRNLEFYQYQVASAYNECNQEARRTIRRRTIQSTSPRWGEQRTILLGALEDSQARKHLSNLASYFTDPSLDPLPIFTDYGHYSNAILFLREKPALVERECRLCHIVTPLSSERSLYIGIGDDKVKPSQFYVGFRISLGYRPRELTQEVNEFSAITHSVAAEKNKSNLTELLREKLQEVELMGLHEADIPKGKNYLEILCSHCNLSCGSTPFSFFDIHRHQISEPREGVNIEYERWKKRHGEYVAWHDRRDTHYMN